MPCSAPANLGVTHRQLDGQDGRYKKDEMHHYLIKTGADVIDVVTNKNEPKVEWLRKVGNAPEGARIVRLGKWGSYFNG